MTENRCRHWTKSPIENDPKNRYYCKDCNIIFNLYPAIRGTVIIGKMSSDFLQRLARNTVSLVDIIKETLGVSVIAISDIGVTIDPERSYHNSNNITFSAGSAKMSATISWYRTDEYEETEETYIPTPVVEEITDSQSESSDITNAVS